MLRAYFILSRSDGEQDTFIAVMVTPQAGTCLCIFQSFPGWYRLVQMALAMVDSSLWESDSHASEGVGVPHAVSERVRFDSGVILCYFLGWWVADPECPSPVLFFGAQGCEWAPRTSSLPSLLDKVRLDPRQEHSAWSLSFEAPSCQGSCFLEPMFQRMFVWGGIDPNSWGRTCSER